MPDATPNPAPMNPMQALLGPLIQQATTENLKNQEAALKRHEEVMALLNKIWNAVNIEE